MPNTKYLGDPSKANWVSEGSPLVYDNSLLLTMPANSAGTLLSSTRYVWYGKISTTMKSSKGAGVVTAFIMMSDVHDEIDFEFIGTDLQAVQSNFYWQGTLNYTNSANLTAQNTDSDAHTYTVDWQPDTLTWSVDGKVLRTLNKADTWNSTTNSYQYPQSPSRVQLSLWPAGEASNGQGTVAWAGGLINWNSPDMSSQGYYSAQIMEVDVQCYDPPPGAHTSGTGAYTYTDTSGLNTSVSITNDKTSLASFFATGEDPNANPNASASGGPSSTSSGSSPVNTNAQTVPGVSSGGARGNDGSNTLNSGSNSGGSSSSGSSSSSSSGGGTNGQFIQGGSSTGSGGSGTSTSASAGKNEQFRSGSVLAVLIAIVALVMI